MILIVSTEMNRRDFRTESCRWINMQTVAPFYPKCAISRTMKSQGRPVLQCGAEEQTVDHVVLQCPIDRPPHGLHGLTVLDDETTEWLLNICLEI